MHRFVKYNGGEQGIRTLETLFTPTRFPIVLLRPLGQLSRMAPQAGFEPATNRLTADRSTTELLRKDTKDDDYFLKNFLKMMGTPTQPVSSIKSPNHKRLTPLHLAKMLPYCRGS